MHMIQSLYLYNINAQNRIILSNSVTKKDIEVHAHYQYAPQHGAFNAPMGCIEVSKCEASSHHIGSMHPIGTLNSQHEGAHYSPKKCSKYSY